jgi:hypothetical protein
MFPNGIPRGPESGRYPAGIRILLLAGAAAFAAVSCIERSNPFDPINSGPTRVRNLRAELQARLDSLAAGEDAYASFLSAYADSLRRDSLANAETEGANAERRTHNLRTAADNDARKAANETASPEARIDSANIAAGDSNGTVAEYNREKAGLNQEIAGYNDSIGFVRQSFNRPVVTRSDSISRAIGIAHAGDTILIGRGSFAVNLQFGDSGTAANPIVVRGYPGRPDRAPRRLGSGDRSHREQRPHPERKRPRALPGSDLPGRFDQQHQTGKREPGHLLPRLRIRQQRRLWPGGDRQRREADRLPVDRERKRRLPSGT